MRLGGIKRFVWTIPWLVLPLEPAWAGGVLALLGVWGLAQGGRLRLWRPFLLFALLGTLGQLFSPSELFSLPHPTFLGTPPSGLPPNLIRPFDLDGMFGWNPQDGGGGFAERREGGFWRLPRRNPRTGREQGEFLADRWYRLEAGKTYTQSFYLRHDGTRASFQITFFTEQGHHPVPTQMAPVAPGVWRVWGSYTAQEGDRSVRAIDFLNGGGDWTYLEVGWAQLEEGTAPTPYRPGVINQPSLWQRVSWWIGTALISGLVLSGSMFLLQRIEARWVAAALTAGLALHLGYGIHQLLNLPEWGPARASGFSPQPNLFGHGAVVVAGLAWLLGGSRIGGLALMLATGAVWASGSRTAFLALLMLLVGWVWSLRRWRWVVLVSLLTLGAGLVAQPEHLGRLAGLFNPTSIAEARPQIWEVAWQAFREHPWGGVGWGQFPLYYKLNLPAQPLEVAAQHGHNLLLQLLAEGGVLGLLAFLSLWGGVALMVFRSRERRAGLLLLLALLLNTFDYTWFYAAVHYPLWIAVAWALRPAPDTMRG